MILFEIDAARIAIFELECDAPWPIDADRIACGLKASQRMEIEAGNVHFFRPDAHIQAVEAAQDARMHLGVDLSGSTTLPKLRRPLLLKLLITCQNVSYELTYVNC